MYSPINIYGIDFEDFMSYKGIGKDSYNEFMGIFAGYDLGWVDSIYFSLTNDGSSMVNDCFIGVSVTSNAVNDYNDFISNHLSDLITQLKNNINRDPDAIDEVSMIIPSIVTVNDYYSFMDELELYIRNTTPDYIEAVSFG